MLLNQEKSKGDLLAAALACVLSVWASLALKASPDLNVAPLGFSVAALLLGIRRGPLPAWVLGLGSGLFMIGLYAADGISFQACLASLSSLAVCTLFPLPWTRAREESRAAFELRKQPLEEKRHFASQQLAKVSAEVQISEQRGRETDALYHAGREISKLLSLQDTLEFSKEIIRDTLLGSGSHKEKVQGPDGALQASEPCFVLMLVDEDASRFRLGAYSGLEADVAARFETPLGGVDLMNWLLGQGKPMVIINTAAEARLKGIALPPQVRGLSNVPLLIQSQVIGQIVVFDLGGTRLDSQDSSNLRILASQIAIGVEKAMLYDKVQRLSITDGLTGLFVHRHFQSRLEEEIRRAERYKEPVALLMLDIDFFKKYNDNYGHLAGDAVLKRVAALVTAHIESADIAARYGGEEFSVILPKQDKASALRKAEKIRQAVESDSFNFEGVSAKVTVSVGLAGFPMDAMTKKGLLDKADQALYKAKHEGRNRVESSQEDPA